MSLACGLFVALLASSFLPRDPFASLPAIGVIPPVPGSLGWPTPIALIPRKKGEERVVFLGASETVALPYEPPGHCGYGYFLGAALGAATGRKDLLVRADGGVALDSAQLLVQARKILDYGDPSALVFVVGGNEFLNRMIATRAMLPDAWLDRLGDFCASPRGLFERAETWLRARPELGALFARSPSGDVAGFSSFVRKARPGHPALRGLPIGARDRALVLERLENCVRDLAHACQAKRVRLLLALAPHGIEVQAPWCSALQPAPAGLDDFVAAQLAAPDPARMPELEAWIEREPGRADLRHVRGMLLRKLGRSKEARMAFENALELDLAPLHRRRSVRLRLLALAKELHLPFLQLEDALRAEDGLPGPEFFLDYAHPTLAGHQRIARWLAKTQLPSLLPGLVLPRAAKPLAAWWQRFDAGLATYAKTVSPRSRKRARAVMLRTVGTYYLVLGNFRDALPVLTQAQLIFRALHEAGQAGRQGGDAQQTRDDLDFCRRSLAEVRR